MNNWIKKKNNKIKKIDRSRIDENNIITTQIQRYI